MTVYLNDVLRLEGSETGLYSNMRQRQSAYSTGDPTRKIVHVYSDGSVRKWTCDEDRPVYGQTGIDGLPGDQGVTGLIGETGTQGVTGLIGETGSQGVTGLIGTTGSQGLTGAQGIQGTQGVTGLQGTQGIQGTQGQTGAQGIQGTQGTQGVTGLQGAAGSQGTQGVTGLQGIQGTQGTQGVTGLQGIQGTQGTQGVTGLQGTQGTQGTQGETGLRGVTGLAAPEYPTTLYNASPTGMVVCSGTNITNNGAVIFGLAAAGLHRAEIYAYNIETVLSIPSTGQGSKVQCTAFTNDGEYLGATPDHTNDHITIARDGTYLVNVSFTADGTEGVVLDLYGWAVCRNNGASVYSDTIGHSHLAEDDRRRCTSTALISASANDTIELWIWSDADVANDIILYDLNLTVVGIGS